MIKTKAIALVLAFTAPLFIAACGGGGSGGGGTGSVGTAAPTLNLRTAWNSFLKQGGTGPYTISGSIDGVSVSGSGTLIMNNSSGASLQVIDVSNPFAGPGPSIPLSNLSRTLFQFNSNVVVNGAVSKTSSPENWYYDASEALRVIWNVNKNEQTMISSFSKLPDQVTSGTSGPMYAGTVYSRMGYTCGNAAGSYAVTSKDASTLLVSMTFTSSTANKALGQCTTGSDNYVYNFELTSTGILLKSVVGSGSPGVGSVTFTF